MSAPIPSASHELHTQWGTAECITLEVTTAGTDAIAILRFPPVKRKRPLLRLHSRCLFGEVFASTDCDCSFQLNRSLELISKEGGLFIYLDQEGRGAGLFSKSRAYGISQLRGLDTVQAYEELGLQPDLRDYNHIAGILKAYFQFTTVRLLTNNPLKISALESHGIKVERIPLIIPPRSMSPAVRNYLSAKANKLGHLIDPKTLILHR